MLLKYIPVICKPISLPAEIVKSGASFGIIALSGGRGSSAVERATPGEEVPGSIPAVAARSLQVGSVSV